MTFLFYEKIFPIFLRKKSNQKKEVYIYYRTISITILKDTINIVILIVL